MDDDELTLPIPSTAPQTPSALQYTGDRAPGTAIGRGTLPVALVPMLEFARAIAGVLANLEHGGNEHFDLDRRGDLRRGSGSATCSERDNDRQRQATGARRTRLRTWKLSERRGKERWRKCATHSQRLSASYTGADPVPSRCDASSYCVLWRDCRKPHARTRHQRPPCSPTDWSTSTRTCRDGGG